MRLRTLLATVLLAAASLIVPQTCLACSCLQMTFAEAADGAEVIFVGTATGQTRTEDDLGPAVKVTFTVDEVYKGSATTETVVRTPDNSAACGFTFEEGKTYLVMAGHGEAGLETNLCTGTALADAVAGGDLASLGDPQPPAEGAPVATPYGETGDHGAAGSGAEAKSHNTALRWGMGGVGLTALAMMALIWRPRRLA